MFKLGEIIQLFKSRKLQNVGNKLDLLKDIFSRSKISDVLTNLINIPKLKSKITFYL